MHSGGLQFVFPYGATLTVQKPCVPLLSSGYFAYPVNRPIAAVCTVRDPSLVPSARLACFWAGRTHDTRSSPIMPHIGDGGPTRNG